MNLNQHQNQGQPHPHQAMAAYGADVGTMQGNKHVAYGTGAPLRTTTSGSTGSTSNLASKKSISGLEEGSTGQDARIARTTKENAGGSLRSSQAPAAANYLNNDLVCTHLIASRQTKKNCPVGDSHLMNCNTCGAFFPKTSALTIRSTARQSNIHKLYSSDILRNMYSQCQLKQQKEEQHLKISAQYGEVRSLIVDWLCEVTENLRLAQRTLYHSINILDFFLSQQQRVHNGKDMEQSLIMLQGLACLFISAKNYEMDPTVPSSKKFLRQLPGYKPSQQEQKYEQQIYDQYMGAMNGMGHPMDMQNQRFNAKKNELCEQEQYILNLVVFEFDTYPLFFDIVEMFMAQGVMFTTDHVAVPQEQKTQPISADQKSVTLMEKYIDFFSLLSLQDHKIVNTNQYLIACSIISAARKHCNLSPVWTAELVQLTGLQHQHFATIEKRIISKFEQQYNIIQSQVADSAKQDTDNASLKQSQAKEAAQKGSGEQPQRTSQQPVAQATVASQPEKQYDHQQQTQQKTSAMETKQSFNQMKSPNDGQSQDDSKMATQGTLSQRAEPVDTAAEYRPLVLQQQPATQQNSNAQQQPRDDGAQINEMMKYRQQQSSQNVAQDRRASLDPSKAGQEVASLQSQQQKYYQQKERDRAADSEYAQRLKSQQESSQTTVQGQKLPGQAQNNDRQPQHQQAANPSQAAEYQQYNHLRTISKGAMEGRASSQQRSDQTKVDAAEHALKYSNQLTDYNLKSIQMGDRREMSEKSQTHDLDQQHRTLLSQKFAAAASREQPIDKNAGSTRPSSHHQSQTVASTAPSQGTQSSLHLMSTQQMASQSYHQSQSMHDNRSRADQSSTLQSATAGSRQAYHGSSRDATNMSSQQQANQHRNPSLSHLPSKEQITANKLQKSHVFQKLVQNQKKKYEQRNADDDQQYQQQLEREAQEAREKMKGRNITQVDRESRQQELRYKYGSKNHKQNYTSTRMGGIGSSSHLSHGGHQQIARQSTLASNSKNSSNKHGQSTTSASGRPGRNSSQSHHHSSYHQHMSRQKSSTSVTSAPHSNNNFQGTASRQSHHLHSNSGQISNRLMSGTVSSNVRKQQVQQELSNKRSAAAKAHPTLYNRQLSNVRAQFGGGGLTNSVLNSGRASSVNSHSSIGHKIPGRSSIGHSALQNSEAKSLVRQAIKNQKRMEKVGGGNGNPVAGYSSSTSQDRDMSSRYQYEAQQKMQRLRVASGAPFSRGSATSMSLHQQMSSKHLDPSSYPADFRNQRNTSNASRGGGPAPSGRHSTGLTAAAAGSQHIHGSLQSTSLSKKGSASKSSMHASIVNQRPSKNSRPHQSSNQRDISITSGHSHHQQHQQQNSSFNNNPMSGLSMTSYQKVRTTQPQSVKHATESYAHADASGAKINDLSSGGGPSGMRGADTEDLVKNYNQFQQRMKEMKLRAQHLQDLQTMKAMGVGVGSTSNSQNAGRSSGERE